MKSQDATYNHRVNNIYNVFLTIFVFKEMFQITAVVHKYLKFNVKHGVDRNLKEFQ